MQDKNINQSPQQMGVQEQNSSAPTMPKQPVAVYNYEALTQKKYNLNGTVYDVHSFIQAMMMKKAPASGQRNSELGITMLSVLAITPSRFTTTECMIFMIKYISGNTVKQTFIPYKDFVRLNLLPYFPTAIFMKIRYTDKQIRNCIKIK
ncbi:MAG: hypothetical protein VZR09_10685 [Candidatus Gastranaerophilaceae bacterium]|nr:hypothetical protein [Candidatus Gastranaerophilaceae bacterium]